MKRVITACCVLILLIVGIVVYRFYGDSSNPDVIMIRDMAERQSGKAIPLPSVSSVHTPRHYDEKQGISTGNLSDIPLLWADEDERHHLIGLGEQTYAIHCAHCHGTDGQGNTPAASAQGMPSIAPFSDSSYKQKNLSRFYASISRGQGNMPAFSSKLSVKEIWASALHVRRLRDEPNTASEASQ